jgi:nitrile hydratase subunit beta
MTWVACRVPGRWLIRQLSRPFTTRWEAVARALMAVVAGAVEASGGEFRHSIERMEPGHYLTSSYYEHWLTAAATLAVEHGLVTHSELARRRAVPAERPGARAARG